MAKRNPKVVCPHCGADLTPLRSAPPDGWSISPLFSMDDLVAAIASKPPPEGPSIGRRYSKVEVEREAGHREKPKAKRAHAKAKGNSTVQFKG